MAITKNAKKVVASVKKVTSEICKGNVRKGFKSLIVRCTC